VVNIAIDIQTPEQPGRFRGTFRLVTPEGVRFGQRVWLDVEVSDRENSTTAAPPAASSSPTADSNSTSSSSSTSGGASSTPADPRAAIRDAVQSVMAALSSNRSGNPLQTILNAIQSAAASISQPTNATEAASFEASSTAGASSATAGAPSAPFPYTAELQQVHVMGFTEMDDRVKVLLLRYRGNVARTLNQLLADA